MRPLFSITAVLAVTAGTVLAGPPDKSQVPGDAAWLVHVDFEAATASTLGKFILAHRADADFEELDELKTKFGVDPFVDVHALTVFGKQDQGEDAVLLMDGTAAFDNVIEKMTTEQHVTREDVEGYALLVWNDDGKAQVGHIRPGKTPDSRLVYVSSDRERLLVALRTVDHKAPSVAENPDSPLKASPAPGSIVFIDAPEIAGTLQKARQNGLAPRKGEPGDQSALLDTIRSVNIDLGESTGKLFVAVIVTADTDENATNMMQAGQGLLAMGRLLMSGEPELAEAVTMMNAIKITSKERRVLLNGSWNALKIQRLLEEAQKREHEAEADDEEPANPSKATDNAKPHKPAGQAPKKKSKGV